MMGDRETARHSVAIGFSNLGHAYTHLFTILYATAVLYLPRVFDRSYGELLGLSSLGLVLFGVAALPAGWLGDRWSQVGMMVLLFVGMGVGATITGFADAPRGVFVGLSVLGLFAAIYHPVGIAWIVASARKQGMALGVNGVFGNLGAAAAPVFVGVMVDHVSWRAAFVVPGALSIATGIALLGVWKLGWIRDVTRDRVPPAPASADAVKRVFVILTLTMACSGFVYTGLTNTMPKLFEVGLGPELAGNYTRIGLFVGGVTAISSMSSVLGGYLADRHSARSIYLFFWSFQIPLLFVVASTTGPILLLLAALALSSGLTFTAAENLLVAHYTPFRWRSLAYGAKFVLALGVGGLTVLLAGRLFDAFESLVPVYLAFSAAALLATLAALLLPTRSASLPVVQSDGIGQ
jgi:MFS family permease